MGIKASLSKPFATFIAQKNKKWSKQPIDTQRRVFYQLIASAESTVFGKDHKFSTIKSYEDFKRLVPIRSYSDFEPYIEKIKKGEENILWPGKPLYLSKTSGTTSGAKYIPISKASMPNHLHGVRDAILHYIAETGNTHFVDHKMIFIQGSPKLDTSSKVPIGRLSGIAAHHVPPYLQKNRMPSYETNCISNWEEKIDAICRETLPEKMSLISGIPPWVQMYFERLIAISGKKDIQSIFPDFSLFIYGGVNYEPYRNRMEKLIGKSVDSIELYPASEGFIAFQDSQEEDGMLLLLNSGIFYEFIPADQYFEDNPPRLSIEDVELGVNYVIILNTNAGLWGYNLGDTVRFVNKDPYKIVVSGRIKHYTSAFGEHVIVEEVEKAIAYACNELNVEVAEFHLAPEVNPPEGELPYHEWFIEFTSKEVDLQSFQQILDMKLRQLNPYYKDLINGKILQTLKIHTIPEGGFKAYMKSKGKLGGQNKLPRLANNRTIAEDLKEIEKYF